MLHVINKMKETSLLDSTSCFCTRHLMNNLRLFAAFLPLIPYPNTMSLLPQPRLRIIDTRYAEKQNLYSVCIIGIVLQHLTNARGTMKRFRYESSLVLNVSHERFFEFYPL